MLYWLRKEHVSDFFMFAFALWEFSAIFPRQYSSHRTRIYKLGLYIQNNFAYKTAQFLTFQAQNFNLSPFALPFTTSV
jgi:hypothetical protein